MTSTHTGQHKHRINVHIYINIHASSRTRTYDPGIQANQDSSRLRQLAYRDRLFKELASVYCENHTEHANTLRGQNAEF
jgi:hypothetical protein